VFFSWQLLWFGGVAHRLRRSGVLALSLVLWVQRSAVVSPSASKEAFSSAISVLLTSAKQSGQSALDRHGVQRLVDAQLALDFAADSAEVAQVAELKVPQLACASHPSPHRYVTHPICTLFRSVSWACLW
jgi:hypothetical protein